MKHNTSEANKIEKNYTKVDNRIIRSPILGRRHVTFRIWVLLSSLPNDAFISERKIHALTEISGNAFRTAIKTLIELGAVQIIERGGRSSFGNRSNRYRLLPISSWNLNKKQIRQMKRALRPFSHASKNEAMTPAKERQATSKIDAVMPQKMQTNKNDSNNEIKINSKNSESQFSYFNSSFFKRFEKNLKNDEELKIMKKFVKKCFLILESKKYFRGLPAHVEEWSKHDNKITLELIQSILNHNFKGEKGKNINSRLNLLLEPLFRGKGGRKEYISIEKKEKRNHKYVDIIKNEGS